MSVEEQKSHDDALRQELVNVKKVNEAVEGVIQSLERAKENMKVKSYSFQLVLPRSCKAGREPDRQCGLYAAEYLVSHSLPNRTQPTPCSGSFLAGCQS